MSSSQIHLDGISSEAQLVQHHWKQQHDYNVPQDGSCLLEVQLTEEGDEPCQLVPQACVWLSSSLVPGRHGMAAGQLLTELHKTAGMDAKPFLKGKQPVCLSNWLLFVLHDA